MVTAVAQICWANLVGLHSAYVHQYFFNVGQQQYARMLSCPTHIVISSQNPLTSQLAPQHSTILQVFVAIIKMHCIRQSPTHPGSSAQWHRVHPSSLATNTISHIARLQPLNCQVRGAFPVPFSNPAPFKPRPQHPNIRVLQHPTVHVSSAMRPDRVRRKTGLLSLQRLVSVDALVEQDL